MVLVIKYYVDLHPTVKIIALLAVVVDHISAQVASQAQVDRKDRTGQLKILIDPSL